jgi:signal transduction histidine kinase
MNKRLLIIYTVVFLLIGLMLYLYRSSYNSMRIYIRDLHAITNVMVRLERLDALLHFWVNNDPQTQDNLDLYIPSDVAYDSILTSIENLKHRVQYQEERLRLDSIKRLVKSYQRFDEQSDTLLTREQREQYRKEIKRVTSNAFTFSRERLEMRKNSLSDATSLLDRWLVWMLVLAGSLITLATFYSFSFLHLRRKAESFNQTMLETTNNGIISFRPYEVSPEAQPEYEVSYCNEAAMKLLRIPSWKSKTLSTIIPHAVLPDIQNAFAEVIQNRMSKTIEGYLEFGKERTWMQANIAPLDDGVLVSVYDLTTVKSYEQKLTYKIKQLEVANDELQQYAYVTSHDLQEPLRKIQMFSDIALHLKPEQERTKDEYFRKIVTSASHLRDLIQTLLMFTRSTDQPSEFSLVNMNESVRKVLSDLEVLIEEKHAAITVEDLPSIQASELHIVLLFNNLITNSLKYSKPDSTPVVKIRSVPVSGNDYEEFSSLDQMVKYVKISVTDNGVGFEQSLSDKMFTIFQRLYNKDNTPGAGIGLAICRKIVHQHHGFIYAEGKEDAGATFYIFLPYEQPQDTD